MRHGFRLCVKDTSNETNISHKSRDSYVARDWSVHIMYKAGFLKNAIGRACTTESKWLRPIDPLASIA